MVGLILFWAKSTGRRTSLRSGAVAEAMRTAEPAEMLVLLIC